MDTTTLCCHTFSRRSVYVVVIVLCRLASFVVNSRPLVDISTPSSATAAVTAADYSLLLPAKPR